MSNIIIKLAGGLGNQLFQFAFAMSAKAKNPDLKVSFDISFFGQKDIKFPRLLLLNELCSEDDIRTVEDTDTKYNFISNIYRKLEQKRWPVNLSGSIGNFIYSLNCLFGNVLKEYFEYGYNDVIRRRIINSRNTRLVFEGYWADLRYFQDELHHLKQTIFLRNRSNFFEKNVSSIRHSDLMIHIRRGDYLAIGNSENGLFVGTDYYLSAIQLMFQRGRLNADARVWVFTDDYDWCKISLPRILPDVEFVFSPEALTDTESFELMRHFSNIVCANSTYSLWAAYLNYNDENSFVIYPQEWADKLAKVGYRLIPNSIGWIGI